jgi:hypothetical protein
VTARRPRLLVAVVIAAALPLVACGGGGDEAPPAVLVEQIPAAVKVVEARLGGTQRYSEINATPSEVNLFVVDAKGEEFAYVYRDGGLEPPSAAQPTQAATFTAAGMAFEPDDVLRRVTDELPNAAVLAFSVQPGLAGGTGTQLVATLQSAEGGRISVLLGPTGEILGARPEG